ncbi:protein sel-1 homolog 3-like [Littorina saxatilis]|uniref:protein sel-1 homolog 3-like n=1 Tax=Littorina saxatilis TaxID=31220 RepID=UPI0038B4DDCC
MVEEGAKIPASVWQSLHLSKKHYSNNVTLLLELYERCRESKKSEAFIPCSLAMYRVWLLDLWDKYHLYLKTSTFLGGIMALVGTVYFVWHCIARWRHNNVQLYQL